jgi:hypothetical protein
MADLATNISTGQANHPGIHNDERTQINANTNAIAANTQRIGGVITPYDHGLIAWSFDPAASDRSAGVALTSGRAHVTLLDVPVPTTITNVRLYIFTAGTSLTAGQSFAAIYEADGDLLRASADQSTAFASTGEKVIPLSTPYVMSTPGYIKAIVWSVFSGTAPALMRSSGSVAGAANNVGMADPFFRTAVANTGLTTTAPSTIGTQTSSASIAWIGLS